MFESRTIDFSSTDGVQHAKFFLVDRQVSFVGSQNFDWRALNQIHEIGLKINDVTVATNLQAIFEKDWRAGKTVGSQKVDGILGTRTVAQDASLRVVAAPEKINPDGISYTLDSLTSLISEAGNTTIRIQVMEYTTRPNRGSPKWKAIDDALRAAASRNVKVQLMVDISDLKKAKGDLTALAALDNVEVRVVTIPPWSGGAVPFARLIHSKYMVIDTRVAWVGSENWSENYFENTRDVGVITSANNVTRALNQVFEQVWNSAYAKSL
jgi:phosphatidylserine/phosphatidylglycerophosphate/cardiolipin synthase-like enzyme